MAPQAEPRRIQVADRAQAEGLVRELGRVMAGLEEILRQETELLGRGRIRAALALETRKQELAGAYLKGLEAVKANMVALARLVPAGIAELKAAHGQFRAVVDQNQTVLATARAVSEGLVRGVAEEMARQSRPAGYGSLDPRCMPVKAGPLLVSTRL